LDELRDGRKRRHWMWYIFPQIKGLGKTAKCKKFELSNLEEAKAYYKHPVLGSRLRDCTSLVNKIADRRIRQIFSYPDDLKFRSCMTLFEKVSGDGIFSRGLIKYYDGERDRLTLDILEEQENGWTW